MKKSIYSLLLLASILFTQQVHAQATKLKDGTVPGSSTSPAAGALLELESANKGLLFPRVDLVKRSAASPLPENTAGMVVFNTATTNDVVPGLYVNDGSKWVPLIKSKTDSGALAAGENKDFVVTMPVSPGLLTTLKSSGLNPIIIDGIGIELASLADHTFIAPRFYNYSNSPIAMSMASLASYANGSQTKTNLTVKPGDFIDVDVDGLVWGTPALVETELADLTVNNKWYKIAWFVTTDADWKNRKVRISVTRLM